MKIKKFLKQNLMPILLGILLIMIMVIIAEVMYLGYIYGYIDLSPSNTTDFYTFNGELLK